MATSGVEFRPEEPNVARMYDYMLGGKDNFPADREAARRTFEVLGEDVVRGTVQQNRRFLGRAVRYLAREAGIRQFLDIGTGLPTMGNVHEVARAQAPDSRVVYVDNDPVVISHAGYTLHGVEGTAIVGRDLRDPDAIIGDTRVRSVLSFDRPIAVLLVAILHFVADADDPAGIVAALMDVGAAGQLPGRSRTCRRTTTRRRTRPPTSTRTPRRGSTCASGRRSDPSSAGCRWRSRARSCGRRSGTRTPTPRRSTRPAGRRCGAGSRASRYSGTREALAGLGVEVGRERALLGRGDVAVEVIGVRGADDRGGQSGVAEREAQDELHRRDPGLGEQRLDAGGLPVPLADAGLLGERPDLPVLLLRGRAAGGAAADEGARPGVHRLGDEVLVVALDGRVGDLEDVEDVHRDVVGEVGQDARHADEADLALALQRLQHLDRAVLLERGPAR